jgi:phosphotransferase system IIB component
MKIKFFLSSLLLLSIAMKSNAQVTFIQEGFPVFVQVDPSSGATVEFPVPVKMIPVMPKYFDVKPQKYTQDMVASQPKSQADDVTVFSVSPNSTKQDSAIFLLSNGKSIQVNFVPSSSNVQDSFYQLKYVKNSNNNYVSNAKFFLSDEKNLMISMLKDDVKYGQKKVAGNLDIKEYPELDFKLVRTYDSNKIQGYVIKIKNKTNSVLQINPTVLKIGDPNTIILIQNDHETLDSCEKNPDPNPTGTGCFTILRIVVKNQSAINSMTLNDNTKLPFLVQQKPKNEVK